MMKKIVAILCSFALLYSFTACGGTATPSMSNDVPDASQKEENTGKVNVEDNKSTPDETTDKTENKTVFEEIVVVDNTECMVKITGIDADNMWGYSLKAQLENKSAEKTYMFSVESAAINGVQCEPMFATEVAAGKKANENISFSDSILEENGVIEYTDIELTFRVYDSNDWLAEAAAKETVHVYPAGKDKASIFIREAQPSDNVVLDNEYVTVIVTGYEDDEIWGYTVNMFLMNKTDKEIMFSANDVSVNGYMADPFYAVSVLPNKCVFSSMSWMDGMLGENGITEVEEIEMLFRVYDSNDWMADDLVNELIILNP